MERRNIISRIFSILWLGWNSGIFELLNCCNDRLQCNLFLGEIKGLKMWGTVAELQSTKQSAFTSGDVT
jgi:hypothetical protein